MNLRTYVYDRAGVPGVWFYSLDANQPAAVAIARRFFHLPYQHARMKSSRTPGGMITYESVRNSANLGKCRFEYSPGPELSKAAPGSLDFFLIERYRLYAGQAARLWRGAVSHEPYPLCRANLARFDEQLTAINGFSLTGRPPDHVVASPGVNVIIYPLKRI